MECVKQCFEPDRKPIDSLNNYYMKNSVDLEASFCVIKKIMNLI
jgi:hypothetical protein